MNVLTVVALKRFVVSVDFSLCLFAFSGGDETKNGRVIICNIPLWYRCKTVTPILNITEVVLTHVPCLLSANIYFHTDMYLSSVITPTD
jgi:hypothetical protein